MGAAESFLVTFALVGLALGAAGGALAAFARKRTGLCFAAALAAHATAIALSDPAQALGTVERIAAIVIAPLLVFVPPAAGFVAVQRLLAPRGARSNSRSD